MMNIKKISILSAIALVALTNTACSSCGVCSSKKDVAVQLYSVRDDIKKDYASTVKKVGEMGYTAVEAAGYKDGKFYGLTPAEFKKSIEDAGMKTLSSHTSRHLSDKELKDKDFTEALKWWSAAAKAHKQAGISYVVYPHMKKPTNLKDMKTYCEYFNEIGKLLKSEGLEFGYHNHAFELEKIENETMLDFMLKNTNPNYVFFEMDVYWMVIGKQSPVEYFGKYPNRFKLLHIKDLKELGTSGMVGFDAIFNNIEKSGAKHIVVEVERYNYTPFESVKKSLDYLQQASFVKDTYAK